MDYAITFVEADDYYLITARGQADAALLSSFARMVSERPEFSPGACLLCDYRKLNANNLTLPHLQDIARTVLPVAVRFGHAKWAIVTSESLTYSLARVWQELFTSDHGVVVRVFAHLPEAERWLGITAD